MAEYTAELTAITDDPQNAKNSIWTVVIKKDGEVFETLEPPMNGTQEDIAAWAKRMVALQKNQDVAADLAAQIAASGPIALDVS